MRGRLSTAAVFGAVALSLAACAPSREGAAQSIDAAVAALPGVASSEFDYDSGWPKGDERFNLTAVLKDNATPDEAQTLGKAFADMVSAKGFPGSDVVLEVRYRVVDRMNNVPMTSSATVSLDGGNGAGLPAALEEWLGITQSPGVQSFRLTRADGDGADGEGAVELTVSQDAKDGDLQALAKAHPVLDRARWLVTGGSLTQTDPFAADYPGVYRVKGMIPDDALRDLWARIVAEVGAAGGANAETDTSQKDLPTSVNVNFLTSRDREQNLAQAWMVLPLLQQLPQPAKVDFDGALFTIGGCTAGQTGRSTTALEVELRQKFEKC